MESFLKDLKEQVTCSVCLDIYKDPKTLPCLHTFCCECLSNHARVSHRQGKFHCPECRAEIDLPEGNRFDTMLTSFFHNNLSSLLSVRQIGDGSGITCAHCKKRSSNVHYCFDCARFMCVDCLSAHEVMKAEFEGHKVMPVKDFKPENYEALLKRKPFCSERYHEREITKYFCLSCQSCICQICTTTDHRNHEVTLLDKAADSERENIMADIALAKEKEKELKEAIQKFDETISQLETNVATAKRGVSQAAEPIRESEREAITSLEATRVTRFETIYSANEKAKSLLKQMKQAVEFAQNLVQRSSSSDVMQNKENLKQRFKELRDIQVPTHQDSVASVEDLRLGGMSIEKTGASQYTPKELGHTVPLKEKESNFFASQYTPKGLGQTAKMREKAERDLVSSQHTPKRLGQTVHTPKGLGQTVQIKEKKRDFFASLKGLGQTAKMRKKERELVSSQYTPKGLGQTAKIREKERELVTSQYAPNGLGQNVQMKEKKRDLVIVGELDLKLIQWDELSSPNGIAINSKGNIALTDVFGNCVYIFNKEGICLKKIGRKGENAGEFKSPSGITFLNDEEILIADAGNHRIQQVNVQTGTFVKSFGKRGTGKGEFDYPVNVCLDEQHHIVVTEYDNHRMQVITQEGETISIFGNSGPEKLNRPNSCVPYKSMFLVSDRGNNCIKAFDQSGTFLYKFGEEGNQDGQFDCPYGMLVGKSDNLLVCDSNNNRVQQFSLDGRFTGKTAAFLPGPIRIATAPDGHILVTCFVIYKVCILR